MQGYEELVQVNLIHEYRTQGLKNLYQARVECEGAVDDIVRVFGELHFISLMLCTTFGDLLDELGNCRNQRLCECGSESKSKKHGINHPNCVRSIMSVGASHAKLGEWMEAQLLEEEVLKRTGNIDSRRVDLTKNNLALAYQNQGRWKEAEELFVQVLETTKRALGQEHTDNLASMASLVLTYQSQERRKESEELFVQVIQTFKRELGQEHPSTLASMANLALTYWKQDRWKEAEELEVQVMETRNRVLGQEHPDTLTSMANLTPLP